MYSHIQALASLVYDQVFSVLHTVSVLKLKRDMGKENETHSTSQNTWDSIETNETSN